jgi:hypothetical protein
MKTLRNWWRTKDAHRKQNWLLLALGICLISGGFVEYYTWAALIGAIPAGGIVWLEVVR